MREFYIIVDEEPGLSALAPRPSSVNHQPPFMLTGEIPRGKILSLPCQHTPNTAKPCDDISLVLGTFL